MTFAPDRPIAVAAGIACALHLLLFVALRPSNGREAPAVAAAPATRYLARTSDEVRTVWSPAVFSLPSRMSFSRQYLSQEIESPRFRLPLPAFDSFVEVDPAAPSGGDALLSGELMLSAKDSRLGLPPDASGPAGKRSAARRVYLVPKLKARLTGGIVLPPELNHEVAAPWSVRASLGISEQGGVSHVFLDQPLESAALNQQVLKLLYGLRFKAGDAVEGSVEIYSPESVGKGADK